MSEHEHKALLQSHIPTPIPFESDIIIFRYVSFQILVIEHFILNVILKLLLLQSFYINHVNSYVLEDICLLK